MTAELVMMNTRAVAMAADSASTFYDGVGSRQVSFSANKLFNISYGHSVGIMIYQNASIHSVPWETIIKVYREHGEIEQFDTLREYAEHFIKFLEGKCSWLFPEQLQEHELQAICNSMCYNIEDDIMRVWRNEGNDPIIFPGKDFVNGCIVGMSKDWDKIEKCDLSWAKKEGQKEKLFAFVDRGILSIESFKDLDKENLDILKNYIFNIFIHTISSIYSGVVFAGFGTKEIFPSLYAFDVYGFNFGDLRIEHVRDEHKQVGYQIPALIRPFAQSDMIHTFMRGIRPDHESVIRDTFQSLFDGNTDATIDAISDDEFEPKKKETLRQHMKQKNKSEADRLLKELDRYFYDESIADILRGISSLDKDELANVAGALLRLSTLHKKVSIGDDTVGEPIDLAVITKGDGMIWINRKHYFDKELNPQFFRRFRKP